MSDAQWGCRARALPITATLLVLSPWVVSAQESCLAAGPLLALDAAWEQALFESDAEWLTATLADDFVWVHNHATAVDTKASVVERAANAGSTSSTRSRTQSDVEHRQLGSTGVVTGFTVVDRGPNPIRYHFMRTYTEVAGACLLVANHTMEVPEASASEPGQ